MLPSLSYSVILWTFFAFGKECLTLHLSHGDFVQNKHRPQVNTGENRNEYIDGIDLKNKTASKYLEPLIQELLKRQKMNKSLESYELQGRQKLLERFDHVINYVSNQEVVPPAETNTTSNNSVSYTIYPSIDDEDSAVTDGSGDVLSNGSGDDEDNNMEKKHAGSGDDGGKLTEFISMTPPFPYHKKKKSNKVQFVTRKSPVPTYYTKPNSIPLPTPFQQLLPYNNLRKTIHIYYYGPCLFCHQQHQQTSAWKNMRRRQLREKLLDFDFTILVQKHPSGLFTTLLSFGLGRTLFPEYPYLQIHPPISCSCFSRAPDKRFLLVGEFYHGRMTLNNFHPLYEINSFIDVEEIQREMVIRQNHIVS